MSVGACSCQVALSARLWFISYREQVLQHKVSLSPTLAASSLYRSDETHRGETDTEVGTAGNR